MQSAEEPAEAALSIEDDQIPVSYVYTSEMKKKEDEEEKSEKQSKAQRGSLQGTEGTGDKPSIPKTD